MINPDTSDYIQTMRQRFDASKTGWSTVREDYRLDCRFASGDPADQWASDVKTDCDDEGVPALVFDRLNPMVMGIVNATRKERPQPTVMPGDGGDEETADVIEGKLRHIQYASRAEVPYSHAELCATIGGWGFYLVEKEYSQKSPLPGQPMSYDKEPRVKRILDPMCSFPDPAVQEPDFSDAEFWFIRSRIKRSEYPAQFEDQRPMEFPFDETSGPMADDWGDKENVWVAKYYWIERKKHHRVSLWDGTEGREADLVQDPYYSQHLAQDETKFPPEWVNGERDEEEIIVHCDLVDGEKKIEETIISADFIPIVAVTGTEVVSEGTRRFISAIRYKRDQQKFLNAAVSGVAEALGAANHAEYLGVKGTFRSPAWRDGKRHRYLEYDPVTIAGGPAGPPQRDTFEPPIQALSAAMAMGIDGLKGAGGSVDNVYHPTEEISGLGVERRQQQADLSNAHFQMNLVDAQWHGGRIMLQMLLRETDTPRKWQNRKEDGSQSTVPVLGSQDPQALVPGMEDQRHFNPTQGEYGLDIVTGPTYAAKGEMEVDTLLEILKTNPNMWPAYAPIVFKRLGFTDLQEVAELLQPPQIQQAQQAKAQGIPPQAAAQIQQLTASNQQLKGVLQNVLMKLQTKEIETQGKLSIEKLKMVREIVAASIEHGNEHTLQMNAHGVGAAEHLTDLASQAAIAASQPPESPAQGTS
jgi:hypothetical protein